MIIDTILILFFIIYDYLLKVVLGNLIYSLKVVSL